MTSELEVLSASAHGIWLWARGHEYFLPYTEYPWFQVARVAEVYNVSLLRGGHLYWPDLDVDLELDALQHPEQYPLIFKK